MSKTQLDCLTILLIVIPITAEVVDWPGNSWMSTRGLWRATPHSAVARIHGAQAIYSYDRDFDEIAGLQRIEPLGLG